MHTNSGTSIGSTSMRWKDDQKTVLIVKATADDSMVRLAKQALQIQDACNLCGLAQSFARVMVELRESPQNKVGGTWTNQHPIVHLWIDKFAHLAGYPQDANMAAVFAVGALAEGKDIEFEVRPYQSDLPFLRKYLAGEAA
jgi:hypothetical protein